LLSPKYIGIPFKDREESFDGADCYGIVRLYYKNELNIEIFENKLKYDEIKKILMQFLNVSRTDWIKVDKAEIGDVIAMAHDPKHPNIIQHFGIYLGDGKMLHTLKEIGSHIVNVSEYQYFIKGYYRWQS
jgi:cell wall-associated NlpC family hydrolase